MKRIYIGFIFCLIANISLAQSLWKDIPVGASVEQVLKILPGSYKPQTPSSLADGRTKGLVECKGIGISDTEFKATLFFKDGALDRVFLNPVTDLSGQTARAIAFKVMDSLKAKYGAPVSGSVPVSSIGSNQSAEWSVQGLLVKFRFTQYSDNGTGFIQISYISPSDTSNL